MRWAALGFAVTLLLALVVAANAGHVCRLKGPQTGGGGGG